MDSGVGTGGLWGHAPLPIIKMGGPSSPRCIFKKIWLGDHVLYINNKQKSSAAKSAATVNP